MCKAAADCSSRRPCRRNSKSSGVVKTENDLKGYVRVRDHAAFPSLRQTDLLMLNGAFTEVESERGPLTLVPPSMIGPPELIHVDMKDTDVPALVSRTIGKGSVLWLPWNLGSLYYRHSLPAHAALFRDVVAKLLPERQLTTDAHSLVEMSLMRQQGRTLLHLINLSGHSQTAYFAPVPMDSIRVSLAGTFKIAKTERSPATLTVHLSGGRTEFTVPRLFDYEIVVLE
jgi:hypothetical protein